MNPLAAISAQWATRVAKRALERSDEPALRDALTRGANPNAIVGLTKSGNRLVPTRLLHRAVELRWPQGVTLLTQAGADVEARGTLHEATPLFLALEARHTELVQALSAAGASLDGQGWTIDRAHMTRCEELLGWDYPSQRDWVRPIETNCHALLDEFKNDRELVAAYLDGQVAQIPRPEPARARAL